MPEPNLMARVEAILFVATEPLTTARLEEAAGAGPADIEAALGELRQALDNTGLRLSELDGRYRLVTAPDTAAAVRRFLQEEGKSDLTRPALETLAIIAYRGPVTKGRIEQIRGVASETMLRNLLARGLINEAGKSSEPGRPVLYAISHVFLEHFGLTSAHDLPPVPEPET
jgi:segregation and condensation protein B